jgi:hypothetical protein
VTANLFANRFLANFETGLVAPEQVATHPVGARAVILLVTVIEEIVDARVFEETTHDGANTNILG